MSDAKVDMTKYNWMSGLANEIHKGMHDGEITVENLTYAQVSTLRWSMEHQIQVRELTAEEAHSDNRVILQEDRLFEVKDEYARLIEGIDWVLATDNDNGQLSLWSVEAADLSHHTIHYWSAPTAPRLDFESVDELDAYLYTLPVFPSLVAEIHRYDDPDTYRFFYHQPHEVCQEHVNRYPFQTVSSRRQNYIEVDRKQVRAEVAVETRMNLSYDGYTPMLYVDLPKALQRFMATQCPIEFHSGLENSEEEITKRVILWVDGELPVDLEKYEQYKEKFINLGKDEN